MEKKRSRYAILIAVLLMMIAFVGGLFLCAYEMSFVPFVTRTGIAAILMFAAAVSLVCQQHAKRDAVLTWGLAVSSAVSWWFVWYFNDDVDNLAMVLITLGLITFSLWLPKKEGLGVLVLRSYLSSQERSIFSGICSQVQG